MLDLSAFLQILTSGITFHYILTADTITFFSNGLGAARFCLYSLFPPWLYSPLVVTRGRYARVTF